MCQSFVCLYVCMYRFDTMQNLVGIDDGPGGGGKDDDGDGEGGMLQREEEEREEIDNSREKSID